MATIHSLPFEVIRHLLALAHPAGAPGSCSGLRATALVHSTWTAPAGSVLLEHVKLRRRSGGSTERFFCNGPLGFSCQSLTLDAFNNDQLRAVLARANPGGIRSLRITNACEPLTADLFAAPSLSGLRALRLEGEGVPTHAVDDGGDDDLEAWFKDPLVFSPWPTGLRHLALDARQVPSELIASSAATLTRLELSTSNPYFFNNLVNVAPQLTELTELVIHDFISTGPFTLPASLVAFVAGLPNLATLDLPQLGPHQLKHLLAALPAAQPLRRLVTRITMLDADILMDLPQDHVDNWTADWLPALQRCAELPLVRCLSEWRMSVVRPDSHDPTYAVETTAEEFSEWRACDERVASFERTLMAAGVKLTLGPLGGFEVERVAAQLPALGEEGVEAIELSPVGY